MNVAEIIVVVYNTRSNAYDGNRNQHTVIGIPTKDLIKETIAKQFAVGGTLEKVMGYVLVKFDGKLHMCERNVLNPKKPYVRHEINYHPLEKEFSV
jgi:hypothetical protein